jgi:predicted RNA-binding protein with TRAM domain
VQNAIHKLEEITMSQEPMSNDEPRSFQPRGGNNNFQQRRRFSPQEPIPVKEGEIYEVTIEGIGEKGDGIAKVQGFVIIVPHTQQGQRVKVKVTAVRGKVSFGEVVETLAGGNTEAADASDDAEDEDDDA